MKVVKNRRNGTFSFKKAFRRFPMIFYDVPKDLDLIVNK